MTVNGIILLNKPFGISSNGALKRLKYLLNIKKAGLTGILDPIATGMLPVCFQEATKFSRFLLEANKAYEVTALLGVTTETGDIEGKILSQTSVPEFTHDEINEVLNSFVGPQMQVPPMYSALKQDGQPLYKLARQGIQVERKARPIEIFNIQLLAIEPAESSKTLQIRFRVACSKGTYIRSLVEDIGKCLEVGAHVRALHRTEVGSFKSHLMYSLEDIALLVESNKIDEAVLPIEHALNTLKSVSLTESNTVFLKQGQRVKVAHPLAEWVKIFSHEGHFMGVGETLGDGWLAPRRLLQA